MNDDFKRGPRPPDGCTCVHRWHDSAGVLYGVKMMGGWFRDRDEPTCPVHGRAALALVEPAYNE